MFQSAVFPNIRTFEACSLPTLRVFHAYRLLFIIYFCCLDRPAKVKNEKNKEVATDTGRSNFSPWATNTGKNNRRISTFHSTGGALCLSLCRSFLQRA